MKRYITSSDNSVNDIDWAKLAEDNYDKIAELMKKIHMSDPNYDVDIYLYPDGSVYGFDNPGGNSWLNDDHKWVATINHSAWDISEEDYDSDGNYSPENIDDLMDIIYTDIDSFIERMEWEANTYDSYFDF